MSLPDVMSTPMADQADLVKDPGHDIRHPEPSTPNSTKKKRKPRATLTPQHMNALIASYRMHYALYSQARESVTQLVPSSVWKKVYNDFIGLYPDATSFDNEHLKARVRNALKEMESNNSVAEMVQKNEQILKRLKMTGASPLMQQILWRNHNAEQCSQQKAPVISAVPIQLPSSTTEKTSEAPASLSASQPVTASTPTSDEHVVDSESQTMQQSQPSSVQPSQSLPNSSESDSDDGANRNAASHNHVVEQKSAPMVSNKQQQQEPLTARPAPPAPAMGKKALMQTQTSALCKMSVDFNTACTGIMEFLEIHKAKAKQEENKVMLANYEKAREMGVITFEEMKSKARKLLDM